MNVPAARPGGANGGIGEEFIRRIEAAVERGAAAQSPITVMPTISEERMADAVFNSPRGRRVAFDFFGNNRGAVKAQISPP
jgi:hypothetical protein